jgi:hypothetical protein
MGIRRGAGCVVVRRAAVFRAPCHLSAVAFASTHEHPARVPCSCSLHGDDCWCLVADVGCRVCHAPRGNVQVDGHVGYFDVSAGKDHALKGEFSITPDCEIVSSSRREFCLCLKGAGLGHKGGEFFIAARTKEDYALWLAALQAHLDFVRQLESLDMDRVDWTIGAGTG